MARNPRLPQSPLVSLAVPALLAVLFAGPSAAARPVAPSAPPCFGVAYNPSNPAHYIYPNGSTTYDAQGFAIVDLSASPTPKVVFEDRYHPVKAKVHGTAFTDRICTGALGDRVWAGNGDDLVDGGPGNDRLFGQQGVDTLEGGRGRDYLNGGIGRDLLLGDRYLDATDPGSPSSDRLLGGSGDDEMRGDYGDDVLLGGDGRDNLQGGLGNDNLWGQGGNDSMYGGLGDDCFDGGDGHDLAQEYEDQGVDRANANVEEVFWVFTTIEHAGTCSQ